MYATNNSNNKKIDNIGNAKNQGEIEVITEV
jgi:hypothetical protein